MTFPTALRGLISDYMIGFPAVSAAWPAGVPNLESTCLGIRAKDFPFAFFPVLHCRRDAEPF